MVLKVSVLKGGGLLLLLLLLDLGAGLGLLLRVLGFFFLRTGDVGADFAFN